MKNTHQGQSTIAQSNHTDAEILARVVPFSQERSCHKNDVIPMQESETPQFFYVEQGSVEVSYTQQQTKIVVAIIAEGNFFGETGFFDGVSRVRNARARCDSTIRIFDPDAMGEIQIKDPLLYGNFVTLLTRSICGKFRRVLEESQPMGEYAASLAAGGQKFDVAKPLPDQFFQTGSWHMANRLAKEFKARLFDLSSKVQHITPKNDETAAQQDCMAIMDDLNAHLQAFNPPATDKEAEYAWGYLFKEFFPYVMRSRMAERAYIKPKGYAGDFMMMEMIYADQPSGDGILGKLLDRWFLRSTAAEAVRGRRQLLADQLSRWAAERIRESTPVRIMNLACGPNRELFDFLVDCEYTEAIEALCIDIDADALQYTDQHVNRFSHQATIHLMRENLVKWAMGRIRHGFEAQDIIYSAGLMDYLHDNLFVKMIDRCHGQLKPGGVLILGNFGLENQNRNLMDHLLHWSLIYRSEDVLRELFSRSRFGDDIQIISEKQGVNLFAVAVKA
jgi:extracellular factor (EF) 3-hydroxypalmitic acid methyl ester biosynthesis protein